MSPFWVSMGIWCRTRWFGNLCKSWLEQYTIDSWYISWLNLTQYWTGYGKKEVKTLFRLWTMGVFFWVPWMKNIGRYREFNLLHNPLHISSTDALRYWLLKSHLELQQVLLATNRHSETLPRSQNTPSLPKFVLFCHWISAPIYNEINSYIVDLVQDCSISPALVPWFPHIPTDQN